MDYKLVYTVTGDIPDDALGNAERALDEDLQGVEYTLENKTLIGEDPYEVEMIVKLQQVTSHALVESVDEFIDDRGFETATEVREL